MEFEAKKLPQSSAERLIKLEFSWMAPYVPVLAPAYVYMKLNAKFLAVKGPLDFFLPDELERYQAYELLYYHPEIEKLERFRQAGRLLLRTFAFEMKLDEGVSLPFTPYELSDQALRCLGPLWGADLKVDPYFLVAFVQEFMGPLDPSVLVKLRERDVQLYGRGLLFSSWAIFVALQYGWMDLRWLRFWRLAAFQSIGGDREPMIGEAQRLFQLCQSTFRPEEALFEGKWLTEDTSTVALKLASRFERIRHEWNQEAPPADHMGINGRFANV